MAQREAKQEEGLESLQTQRLGLHLCRGLGSMPG